LTKAEAACVCELEAWVVAITMTAMVKVTVGMATMARAEAAGVREQ